MLWSHFQVSQGEVLALLQPVTNPINPDFTSVSGVYKHGGALTAAVIGGRGEKKSLTGFTS